MNININKLLEKYWNAETSLEEEVELRAYFASNDVSEDHQSYKSLFEKISIERAQTTMIDIDNTLININDIDNLVEKYLAAETSLKDEKLLKLYFNDGSVDPKHEVLKPLFVFYDTVGDMTMDASLSIEESTADIDDILSRYLDAETNIAEENQLKEYFNSQNVADEHQEYKPLFAYFDEAQAWTTDLDIATVLDTDTNQIDAILEKYWNAETNLQEEKILSEYFSGNSIAPKHTEYKALFFYYAKARSSTSTTDVESVLTTQTSANGNHQSDESQAPKETNAKVFHIRKIAAAIAAIFVLGFAAVTVMNQSSEPSTQYKGKYVQLDEEAEAQEAYEITKQAFALLSKKMNKGSKTVNKSMKKAKNASIFK